MELWAEEAEAADEEWASLPTTGAAAADSDVREFLLATMLDLSLLCKWWDPETAPADGVSSSAAVAEYLVPSLLDMNPAITTLEAREGGGAVPNAEATFELDFSQFFLPDGFFARLVAVAVEHASGLPNSRRPWVSKAQAVLSFGEADFVMRAEPGSAASTDVNVVRVGVADASTAPFVLSRLCSMVEKLRDEVAGRSLVFRVVLQARTGGHPVLLSVAEAARKQQPRPAKVRSMTQVLVALGDLDVFFDAAAQTGAPPSDVAVASVVDAPPDSKWDVFLSHYQLTGSNQCLVLFYELERVGLKAWLDTRSAGEITQAAMANGVHHSSVFLLFLSRSVMTRPYVQFEVREAKISGKPIIMVYDAEYGGPAFVEFHETEAIPYRKRLYETDAMVGEIKRRVMRCG